VTKQRRERKLERLPAGDAGKLLALAKAKGLRGLKERDAEVVLPLDHAGLVALAQKLEEGGALRIMSFSPLTAVAREAIDFLGAKLLPYLAKFHETHPKEKGLTLERIKARFDAPKRILLLALKTLVHEGALKEDGTAFALAGFTRELSPREEKLLRDLEEMCFHGDFRTVTLQDIRETFKLTPRKLDQMLDILVERKRIVQNKEGFFLHRRWLDGVVARVRGLGRREMSVAEFKALTGLSRKFAIPLLELLDEMGVTRRRGATREIL
jgi:selenocysteine-specific elongation factor